MLKARSLYSVKGLVVIVVLLLTINLLADLFLKNIKVDLTEDGLYTLSEGTQNILGDLKEPITFSFYFSEIFNKNFLNSY